MEAFLAAGSGTGRRMQGKGSYLEKQTRTVRDIQNISLDWGDEKEEITYLLVRIYHLLTCLL